MNFLSDYTQQLFSSVTDPFERAFILAVLGGETLATAYVDACHGHGKKPASSPANAAKNLLDKPHLKDVIHAAKVDHASSELSQQLFTYHQRRLVLDKALAVADVLMKDQRTQASGAELAIKVVKQIHAMTVSTANDEFHGMSIEDLERELEQ